MPNEPRWFDDDSLWERIERRMNSKARLESAVEEVGQLLELTGVAPGSAVLDLCCGSGRHSIELARRGMNVTAVDRTQRYLDHAAEKARAEGLEVEFIRSDMREFSRPGAFDLVINMLTSFGYFRDPNDDALVVRNMSGSLNPGGRFLIQTIGKEILARIFQPNDWDEEEDGVLFLRQRRVMQDWGWMDNRWIVIDGADRFEFNVSHRLFSAVELKALVAGHGFSRAEAYGGTDGSVYDQTAKQLVVIGHK